MKKNEEANKSKGNKTRNKSQFSTPELKQNCSQQVLSRANRKYLDYVDRNDLE